MKMCALKVGVCLFTFAGLFLGSSAAYAAPDPDPTTWKGEGLKVAPLTFFGIDDKNNVVEIDSIAARLADAEYGTMKHDNDGTKDYPHFHFWDADATAKVKGAIGADDFSTDNQTLAQKFWDFAFGVNVKTGNGKLDGDDVTALAQKATMNGDCETFALTAGGYKGTWGYGLASGTDASAARDAVTKAGDKKNVLAKDILYYTNGEANLGYHFTLVATVDTKQPKNLQWKYQYSGTYQLVRKKNFFDSPMYWVSGTMAKDVTPDKWKLLPAGAGDSSGTMGVYTKP
jgi:hypothetical protein